jgi:hypothetical protein
MQPKASGQQLNVERRHPPRKSMCRDHSDVPKQIFRAFLRIRAFATSMPTAAIPARTSHNANCADGRRSAPMHASIFS